MDQKVREEERHILEELTHYSTLIPCWLFIYVYLGTNQVVRIMAHQVTWWYVVNKSSFKDIMDQTF